MLRKRKKTCTLCLRVPEGRGKQPYYSAFIHPNGTVKPFYCLIGGRATHRPDGIYYIRYRDRNGKRHFECVGNDIHYAVTAKLKRDHILAGEAMGVFASISVAEQPPITRPEPPDPIELAIAGLPRPDAASDRLSVAKAFREFVKEKEISVSEDCADGYRHSLGTFIKTCKKAHMDEIGDSDVLVYIAVLKKAGLAARTISNRCASLSAFMRRYDFKKAVKKSLVPRYTEKIVSAYSKTELRALFAAANPEELLLFQFFLGLGLREQEVMYAAWADINFNTGLFKVSEKLDVGFGIKDKEERLIPIPSELLASLKKRFEGRHHPRWIFPTRLGKPDGHFLRHLQKLAHSSGLNCGHCRKKHGKTCAETGACSRWGLHKFRKTFATLHHRAGVSLTDLMHWLGHATLATTQAYLAASDLDSQATRDAVDNSFVGMMTAA